MNKKLTIRLSPELHKALKKKTVDKDISIQSLAVQLLTQWLKNGK